MENINTINSTIDLVFSLDQDAWYFQEYKMNGTGSTRISQLFDNRSRALRALAQNEIIWTMWD